MSYTGPGFAPTALTEELKKYGGDKKRELLLAGTGTLQLAVRNSNGLEIRRPTAVLHLSVLSMLELYSAINAGGKIRQGRVESVTNGGISRTF